MKGGRIAEVCFQKELSDSDINTALEIPGGAMNLPPADEDMRVLDQNNRVWTFNAGTRRDGRRHMRKNWRRFKNFADPSFVDATDPSLKALKDYPLLMLQIRVKFLWLTYVKAEDLMNKNLNISHCF
ncbi:hypothetical protein F0562_030332 [Nyssa sinensis]|uniref:TF-B3 domain-containing protein n=1 Tax=Nyssa sinensis TaxID=561372 RepID=A0A5J5AY85_9ASTE|nr:hypothetical protein F0562_030332 [Nyssa sinensis]